ncbi:MAG: ISAs1 family transposase [Hyphomicrobiales bacterium]|nr:ISAs1 family transposase [Hyphomicrobiales bacterium]
MTESNISIQQAFADMGDPRVVGRTTHKLIDIVVIAICAIICGAESWVDVEVFGKSKEAWLRQFLELPDGIPVHDTFGRVFGQLDAEAFQQSFNRWVKSAFTVSSGQVVAIDGKTVRRSHDKTLGKKAIHMVSAWAQESGIVLGQVKTDEKSNEITAIPELLNQLYLKGCIVTLDAMGCQKAIAETIIERGADYVLPVKGNQGNLEADLQDWFDYAQQTQFKETPHTYAKTINKGHGRIEIRECWAIDDPLTFDYIRHFEGWTGLRSIALVRRERRVKEQVSVETQLYISSLPADAERILHCSRLHWSVENSLHWVLDVVFHEDAARNRTKNSAENFTVLRHIALNLLKQTSTRKKTSIKNKRFRAALDDNFLLQVLQQI